MAKPQTITQKILAAHAGKDFVEPGELILAKVDIALANDITAPLAIRAFQEAGAKQVFDRERVVLVLDHFAPNKDIASATQCQIVRRFAQEQQLRHFYDGGEMGVEHALLPEKGIVGPGDLIVGADSHTCTYGALGAFASGVGSTDLAAVMITGEVWLKVPESMRFVYTGKMPRWVTGKDLILATIGDIGVDGANYRAMEFTGEAIRSLSMDERLSMANMAVEAGAKNGIIAPDEITLEYVRDRALRPFKTYASDSGAAYLAEKTYDVSRMEPQVAMPPSPENVRPVSQVKDVRIDQSVIGSCTNGRLGDLRLAAQVLKGRKVSSGVRLIVIPATPLIYRQAMDEGLLAIFMDAGAVIGPPTCGPCLGGHMGILAPGEVAVATTNRNFTGRMGHPQSQVYLANPAVAAASAVTGRICGPEDL
ncbi:MAG: 3-isopropylmalate dehydratase large subunit [Deltaproteobacteria bacterium]|nr:3-isopropylmalate dehydratase large subunit [Deltaproteobacteria bacterium]MBI4795301.1 3-isopropylmalate dehydratase large subunit [Deltaproteobacteria bacterium]